LIIFLIKLFIILSLFFTLAAAKENDWELYKFTSYFENDFYSYTDNQYTSGEKFTLTYYIPKSISPVFTLPLIKDSKIDTFVSISIANQIFTPSNTRETKLIVNDRPYCGWTFLEAGVHKSSKVSLSNIYLQIGMVGSASKSEKIQNGFHNLIRYRPTMGWSNQIKSELGVNLHLVKKWRFTPKISNYFENAFTPFVDGYLGNVSTLATIGLNIRFGWNIPKDFGVSTIDRGGESNIPIYNEHKNLHKKLWSFSFNLSGAKSGVIRDITLDGNTFKDSHSVKKNNFINYIGYGISVRYNNFIFDFMQTKNSKKFKYEKSSHSVGTLTLSWLF